MSGSHQAQQLAGAHLGGLALGAPGSAYLADPKLKAQFAELGAEVLPGSPAGFGMLIAAETEKWAKVIRAANIKAP
jgi:hypothetical protein